MRVGLLVLSDSAHSCVWASFLLSTRRMLMLRPLLGCSGLGSRCGVGQSQKGYAQSYDESERNPQARPVSAGKGEKAWENSRL